MQVQILHVDPLEHVETRRDVNRCCDPVALQVMVMRHSLIKTIDHKLENSVRRLVVVDQRSVCAISELNFASVVERVTNDQLLL